MSDQRPQRQPLDPFRVLALAGIILGLLIVVGASILWYLTGRQSTEIMTTGVVLAGAGGVKELGERFVNRMPSYYRPEPYEHNDHEPEPSAPKRKPRAPR